MDPIITEGAGGTDHIVADGKGGFQAFGGAASRLLASGFNVNSLRTNTVLMKDEWKALDAQVIGVSRQRLRGVQDLISRGLTYNLRNPLGTTRLEWETSSDLEPAQIDMSGITEGLNDRLTYGLTGIPIPIIHKDFHINIRALEASRKRGEALDTAQAGVAARKVAEKLEGLLFSGGYGVGANGTIYGYTNHPNRNTGSVTASWATAATGAQYLADILAMIGKAHADRMWGPYVLYVPDTAMVRMGDDFKAESDRSIIERLRAIDSIAAILPSDNLTGTNAVLVQMTSDVVDIVDGLQPTTVMWEEKGGMQFCFKVMAIMVPRIKADSTGNSGIVHYS